MTPDINISMRNNDSSELVNLLELVKQQLVDDKIEDIIVFDCAAKSTLTSYVFIGSGILLNT